LRFLQWKPRRATLRTFSELVNSMYVIVGVDPGTTFAIAAVDLNGRFIGAWSARDAGKEKTLQEIQKLGIPCLIASDVARAPDAAVKLAAYANTRLFTPPRDLGQQEKLELARGCKCANEHELDALAAALKAYHYFENKMRLIDRVVAERGFESKAEDVKRLAIGGVSVHNILLLLEKPAAPAKEQRAQPAAQPESRRDLLAEISLLANSNAELRKAVERMERENSALKEKLARLERGVQERLLRDSEIRYKDRIIYTLKGLLARRRGKKSPPHPQPKKSLKAFTAKGKSVNLEGIIDNYRQG